MPLSLNPFRKKTPDELNAYTVEIDLSNTYIKKVRRTSQTSAKFVFSCKKPFPVNVKFKTFDLDSLKSHFKNNNFKFKKFVLYADFEKENIDWLMEEAKKDGGLGQAFKNMSKSFKLSRLYAKIKKANQGFKYENKRGKSEISFSYGGRHERKFIKLPKKVYLKASVDFEKGYSLNIGTLRPMKSTDKNARKLSYLYFKSPELSKAILKAIKYKVLGKKISETVNKTSMQKNNKKLNEGGGAGYTIKFTLDTFIKKIEQENENTVRLILEPDESICSVEGYDWGASRNCKFERAYLSLNIPTLMKELGNDYMEPEDLIGELENLIGEKIEVPVKFNFGNGWTFVPMSASMVLDTNISFGRSKMADGEIYIDFIYDFDLPKNRNIHSGSKPHQFWFFSKDLSDLVKDAHEGNTEEQIFEKENNMKKIDVKTLKEKVAKKCENKKLKLSLGEAVETEQFKSIWLKDETGEEKEFPLTKLSQKLSYNAKNVLQDFRNHGNPEVIQDIIRDFLTANDFDFASGMYEEDTPRFRDFDKFVQHYTVSDDEGEEDSRSAEQIYDDETRGRSDDDDDDGEEYEDDEWSDYDSKVRISRRDRIRDDDDIYDADDMGDFSISEKKTACEFKQDKAFQESLSRFIKKNARLLK